jgi:hypothetical protein
MNDYQQMVDAYKTAGGNDEFSDSDAAHLVIERDKVVGSNLIEGIEVDIKEQEAGKVALRLVIKEGAEIEKPVHLCFGVLPEEGLQKIDLEVEVQDGAKVDILAHCVFPNAEDVKHIMDAKIHIGKGGKYSYEETHFHGESGGIEVIAKANITLEAKSSFENVFKLLEGRVGKLDFDYDVEVNEEATMELVAKVRGVAKDKIKIREAGQLTGEGARGFLDTKISLQDEANAEIISELVALAAEAKGHVDCTEIVGDDAIARAVPVVDVRHPEAKITHEAAIGSVDSTQLQTLMARGLDEEEATEVIIQGLLGDN